MQMLVMSVTMGDDASAALAEVPPDIMSSEAPSLV